MANQGPLVRVDTDGRGTYIKMTSKDAEAFVAANPGASVSSSLLTLATTLPAAEPAATKERGKAENKGA